jgi:hypothetical protein
MDLFKDITAKLALSQNPCWYWERLAQNPSDKREMKPMLEELRKNDNFLGKPKALGADAGYFSEENVKTS